MPLDQNSHQTVIGCDVLDASAFQCMRAGFCAPNATILFVNTSAKIKMSFTWKNDFFFAKIGIFCKSIAGPGCEVKTHWVVNYLQLLNQLDFVWRHTKVSIMSSKCSIIENDDKLVLRALHAHFMPQQQYSRVYALCLAFHALVYWWGCQFFHFFHKITNVRSWRCFSSSIIRKQFSHTFCNITMIFKVMLQYFTAEG